MLGASGVLCGTAFFASDESLASHNAKQAAVDGSGDDTERHSVFDAIRGLDWPQDWNLRAMRNGFTEQWRDDMNGLHHKLSNERARFKAAQATDDTSIAAVIVGEATDLVRTREPAKVTLHRMLSQAEEQLVRAGQMVG